MDELRRDFTGIAFISIAVDLGRRPEAYMRTICEATAELPISVVVNNAGYLIMGFFHERSMEAHAANIECNQGAAVRITHHFYSRMVREKRRGCICFTSSAVLFMVRGAVCFVLPISNTTPSLHLSPVCTVPPRRFYHISQPLSLSRPSPMASMCQCFTPVLRTPICMPRHPSLASLMCSPSLAPPPNTSPILCSAAWDVLLFAMRGCMRCQPTYWDELWTLARSPSLLYLSATRWLRRAQSKRTPHRCQSDACNGTIAHNV